MYIIILAEIGMIYCLPYMYMYRMCFPELSLERSLTLAREGRGFVVFIVVVVALLLCED